MVSIAGQYVMISNNDLQKDALVAESYLGEGKGVTMGLMIATDVNGFVVPTTDGKSFAGVVNDIASWGLGNGLRQISYTTEGKIWIAKDASATFSIGDDVFLGKDGKATNKGTKIIGRVVQLAERRINSGDMTAIDSDAVGVELSVVPVTASSGGGKAYDDTAIKADINTNKTNIAANKADIATNKTGIAANKADIATNKTSIAANKTEIDKLKNPSHQQKF